MIISKTNIIANNDVTLSAGTIADGSFPDMLDPDFSKNLTSTSSTFSFVIESIGFCEYIALHGLAIPAGSVVTLSGTGVSETFTITRYTRNLVFYFAGGVTPGDTTITIAGVGSKTISYVQAGEATSIDWGTNPGQALHYLASQRQSRVTSNKDGLPVKRVQEIKVPRLRLTIRNALKSWARGDLQAVREMYDDYGVLSQLDYENDSYPDESCALFELSDFSVKTHSQTTKLVDVSLTFMVLA